MPFRPARWRQLSPAPAARVPGLSGPKLAFLMYQQAENGNTRLDCLDADAFKYTIPAKELAAA
jgi:hypothetical protein